MDLRSINHLQRIGLHLLLGVARFWSSKRETLQMKNAVICFKNNDGRWGYKSGNFIGPKSWATKSYALKALAAAGLNVIAVINN